MGETPENDEQGLDSKTLFGDTSKRRLEIMCGKNPDLSRLSATMATNTREMLLTPREGRLPFIIPGIPAQQGTSLQAVLFALITAMYIDPWLRENAIVVCFGTKDPSGSTALGFARKKDRFYWESQTGQRHLRAGYVNIYTMESYQKLIEQELGLSEK